MSYVKTPLMGLGQTTAGDIPDPWTQRKAAQFNKAIGLGQDLAPPPPGAMNWPVVIGWGALLAISGFLFFGTTSGIGTHKHVRANSRRHRRRAHRNGMFSPEEAENIRRLSARVDAERRREAEERKARLPSWMRENKSRRRRRSTRR